MTALAGGTGSAKLLRGLSDVGVELTVVANVGDNYWVYGLYVCPDVDIATYALAGVLDSRRGWGVKEDSFAALESLRALGGETWFRLGDKDMATSIRRTELLSAGKTLTEATDAIRASLGIKARVLPCTDSQVMTEIRCGGRWIHLQEFWVRDRGAPEVEGVRYRGARGARATDEVKDAIARADVVVVCPANPITSIGPMLAVGGVGAALRATSARVVAVSPMVGTTPFSGPAGKLMRSLRLETTSV
ncbi:MAG TPA: 2-phospho-L-lactate transferase, partial [Nitrososphaerales archaeon]|nr:2-phospho-L-lactate transferase [Nitrososphaerales archaeon]